jgi:hypothetical protein
MVTDLDIPRRIRIDLFTPAEKAIFDAVQVVEQAGAHPLLTDAVILLGQAREKVADFVDFHQKPEPLKTIPRTAKITKLEDGKIKLEFFGTFSVQEDLRTLNTELSALWFCSSYPVGCNRLYADTDENLPAAVELLKRYEFDIEFVACGVL